MSNIDQDNNISSVSKNREQKRKRIKSYILYAVVIYIILWKTLFGEIYHIPTTSMTPAIAVGDIVLCNKMAYGTVLPQQLSEYPFMAVVIYACNKIGIPLKNYKFDRVQLPGYSSPKRGDVVLTHLPGSPKTTFLKRLVALPGDTVSLKEGILYINNKISDLERFAPDSIPKESIKSYPHNNSNDWTIRDFGPLVLPNRGDTLELNTKNLILYRRLIEWFERNKVKTEDSAIFVNNRPSSSYIFEHDYYFFMGDNRWISIDCRMLGPAPDNYIIGRSDRIVWSAVKNYVSDIRWSRIGKSIRP